MPRNVKDSEDELETKSGRKTRTMLNPSVLDSPLRRSSRIRQPMSQNDLSPEYNSDASVTSGTKSTRRRTTALDAINPEPQRNLRTRHNSATSDLSELAENDSATESIGKRITRRSIATVSSVETSSKLPPKTRRATRAGSETKSTPPVGRVTRRTRASSMEPEITDDTRIEKGDTPLKTRKRALAMPSEPAVVEESEDSRIDKTVFDTDEDESETSPNVSKSSRRKSKGDATEDEKMEVDETRVVESEVDTTDRSYDEKTEESCKVSDSRVSETLENQEETTDISEIVDNNEKSPTRQSISSLTEGSSYTIGNSLGDESPGNKESKISNTSYTSPKKTSQAGEIRLSPRKSLNPSLSKIAERHCSVTLDTELVSVYQETKKISKAQENAASKGVLISEISTSKDYSLDTKCLVVIKPINVEQLASSKNQFSKIGRKQDSTDIEDKKGEAVLEIYSKLENNKNVADEIHVTKIIDVINLEEECFEEQEGKSVKYRDDLQINEITDSSHTIDTPRVCDNSIVNQESHGKSSTIELEESLTDEEASMRLIESEENDDIIFCDETTSESAVTLVRDGSLEEKDSKNPQEIAQISCKKVTTTIITEVCEEDEDKKISSSVDEEAPLKLDEETASKAEEANPSESKKETATEAEESAPSEAQEETALDVEEATPLKPDKETPSKPGEKSASKPNEETASKAQEEIASKPEKQIEFCKIANPSTGSITNRVSADIEMSKECDDSDETKKISDESLKDRNPSIVTELPVKETYAEDSLKELDAPEKRRSIGESGNEPEGIEKKVEANEESDGMQVFESDNESESIVCPSFKDIPADEWVDRGNKEENSKSNQDSDSVHSYSTEKNENELDVALGDKEPWQPSRKNKRDSGDKNTNDDSDDTIIAKFDRESNAFVEIGGKLVDGKRLGKDELNEEAPMDVSDNAIDEYEQEESNVSKKTPKKRSSLDSSTKHPNDNEKTSKNRSSESPLNVSRHSESNLSNKSVKRRSLNASQQKEKSSDDEYNSEMNESRKSLQSEQSSRKSLLASAKKSNTSVFNTSTSENRKSLNKPDFQSLEDSGTEEIEKKSRRSESKRNSLNNSKAEQTNVSLKNVEENESSEKLNESSKSDSKRTSMNDRRSSKNAEEVDNSSEKLNESSKSTSIKKPLENGADSDVELESSGSEIDKFDNLLQQLNESTKSKNARESLNKNTSRSQEQSSDSENEGNSDSHGKLNRSTKSMSDRRSLNKKTSKIQELSSESENEEESAGLNRSSKSTSDRKSLNNKTVSEIPEENSESGINEETTKLNRSTKSVSGRKSLNKNTSKIQEENSESENENQPAQLNRSTKSISGRKSLNNKSTSKNQGEHSESEIDEEIAELSRSTKSVSGRKSLNKNTSIIQEQSSNSEMEEETDSQTEINRSLKSMSDRKSLNLRKSLKSHEQSFESELNRSSKSTGNRKSLTTKNTSKIQEESSDSEMEEEEEVQLNQSSKSTTNRKSLSNKNSSKIQEQSSGSEIEEVQLNQSSKSTTNRKSLSNKNIPEIQEQNSGSETENENNSEVNQSAKSKKKLSTTHNGSITKPVESEKDSDSESSTNEDNSSQKLPLFLREENTCSGEEEEDSDPSIDPDIVNEMNLHGKSSLVYSDDDVPGDDCMATESESNDSEDDDGEDLKDFVVHDDEYDSEDDGDSELGDDEQESAHKIRKVKNKKRKRIIPTASSDEDSLDSEKEDEIKKSSKTFFNKDDSLEQTKTRTNKKINESLKAKNSKSPVSSSTLASEEDSENVRVTPNSGKKSKTPKKSLHKNNDSIQVLEEIINLNESVQGPLKKAHKLLSQSSTPKLSPNKKKTLEKLNSSKSSKLDNSKLEISVKSPETESNAAIDTPAKLSMSSRGTKTPKTPKSQLQMSLPIELNVSRTETILSNVKSPKLSALHQTMTTIVNDNSETRFLMKEKLNESLPASNLVQSGTGLRRSVLLELRGKMEREKAENSERNVATTIDQSIIEETVEPEAANVGKKKKKNKKKKEASVEIVENVVTLDESQEQDDTDVTSKKSKKRKKNKNQVGTMEVEETGEIEMEKGMKKKKKKQKTSQVELSKEIVHDEAVVEKKKKKQKTNVEEDIAEESEKKKKKRMKHVTIVVPEEMIEDSIKTPKKTKAQSTISTGNTKIIQSATDGSSKGLSTRIKRLPEDVLESLSQNSERPKKRRKIANENQIFPSESMFSPGGQTSQNVKVEDDYISLSSFGGTTRFESVDLSKFMKKPNKKSSTVQSFRERMLSRNPRQPISAYLMYQQKQKAAGKNKRN